MTGDWLERAARVGYAANGVVHLVVAWLALQIAGSSSAAQQADAGGALRQLAQQPFGAVLLVLAVVGFAGLAVLHAVEALLGGRSSLSESGGERAKAAGKAAVYGFLAATALRVLLGSGGGGSSAQQWTARLMSVPAGRLLVGLVGLAVLGVAAYYVHKGWTRSFVQDLERTGRGGAGRAVVRLGRAGYVAKGLALAVVGALLGLAALQHDPQEAGGLDAALRTLAQQPYGVVLLLVVAAGIAAYGLYSLARARLGRVES